MHTAVYVSPVAMLRELVIDTVDDIAHVVGEKGVESLRSADGQVDFWFTPSVRPSHRCNWLATRLLLGVSVFGAADVPLLHGNVVLAAHDEFGGLAGLTQEHVTRLRDSSHLTRRAERVLDRRFTHARRIRRRRCKAVQAAAEAAWLKT